MRTIRCYLLLLAIFVVDVKRRTRTFAEFVDDPQFAAAKISEEQSDDDWIIYEPDQFDKNELCTVLICQSGELCLVKNNNAMCGILERLDEIPGKKHFYKRMTATDNHRHANSNGRKEDHRSNGVVVVDDDDGEWDQNRLRDKTLKHVEKMLRKQEKKAKENVLNEVDVLVTPVMKHESLETHKRHSSAMGHYENCTLNELNSVKGRLFKWFSDIHATQKSEPSYELPKHEMTCQEDVGFMFTTLDGDKDGKLSVEELFSIDNDPHEKCVKPFLDRCDTNSDDYLSINEWCDCFHWADDDRHEPACHVALRKHDPHDPDSFFPKCDVDGYFTLDQCHRGQCWCVDKWGREFDGSRSTKGKVHCHKFVI